MKDRYKCILLLGATCIVVMLVYFWLRSSKDAASQGPTLGTQLAESIKKYIDTPLPLTYETSAKKYRNKHKTKNNISEDTHTGNSQSIFCWYFTQLWCIYMFCFFFNFQSLR